MYFNMKSWSAKLNQGHEPRLKILEKKFAGMPRGSKMFIATPKMIQKYVNAIPLGKLIDVKKMREDLAKHPIEKVGKELRAMMPWIGKNKLVDKDKN